MTAKSVFPRLTELRLPRYFRLHMGRLPHLSTQFVHAPDVGSRVAEDPRRRRLGMALARVVSFDGASSERMADMQRDMEGSERPDSVPATEIIVLHDADAERALVVVFFETEDDYRLGDE